MQFKFSELMFFSLNPSLAICPQQSTASVECDNSLVGDCDWGASSSCNPVLIQQ